MSTSTPPALDTSSSCCQPTSFAQCAGQRHFMLRRIHSLFGLLFGGYIVVHLLVNATAVVDPKIYQANVDKIHDLEPMLPLIEIVAIFLPLLFHTIYGIYIANAGVKFNTTQYNYCGNVRYFLQRVTAVILLLFIAYHVGTLHRWGLALIHDITGAEALAKYPLFNDENLAYQSTVRAIQRPFGENPLALGNLAVMSFYLLGILSATFHFANGLWTSAIAWGLTVTAGAQKRWGHVCAGLFVGLTLVGATAWVAFTIKGDPNYPESKTTTHQVLPVHP